MIQNYLSVIKNYVKFSGRARRREYWLFALCNIIVAIIAMVLDNLLGMTISESVPYGPIYIIYALFVLLPGLSVFVRRLHDVNKSGWWFFIALIPLIGAIWLLVLLVKAGDVGSNQYGPDPKAEGTDISDHLIS